MKYALFVLLIILIACPNILQASSVTKTVGVGQDYTTIGDALAAVNSLGLADTVSLALMDTTYTESPLMYNPTTPQPLALYMYQAGPAKPHVQVNAGGLPFGMMITNRAEFVLYNVLIEPSTSTPWMAGVSVRSMDENSKVYIQSGGVTGSTTQRGYDVLADSSSEVNIFGCLVINVQSVGIYIELQNFALANVAGIKGFASSPTGGSEIRLIGNTITDADTGIIMRSSSGPMSTTTAQADSNTFDNVSQAIEFDNIAAGVISFSHNTVAAQPYYDTYRQVMNKIGAILAASGKTSGSASPAKNQFIVNGNLFEVGAVTGSIIEVDVSGFDVTCSNNTMRSTSLSPVGVNIASLQGMNSKYTSEGNVISGFDIGTQLDGIGEFAEIQINGNTDTVASKAIYLPNGHNVSVFHVGSSSTASVLRTRYRVVSLEKMLSAKLGKQISATTNNSAIDVTINNDSTVLCDFSISNTDFDWIGTAITGNKKFLGNSTISGNTFSVIGYASLPVMAITTSSAGIEQVSYDDSYNGNIGTHEMGHNWLSIELDNESGNPIFGPITISGNTIPGATTAMQLRAKRAELPTNVEKVTIVDNTFTGNSIYEGIAFELADINVKNGVRFDSNRVSNTNVAFQYRAKRAEVQPNISGIKTAELSHNTIYNVQTGFSFVFDPDSAAQAIARIPFFEPIEMTHNSIGKFTTTSIPNFVSMQLRSKRSEVPPNIEAITISENFINGNGEGTAIDIPFNTIGSLQIDHNTVQDARYNLLLGALSTKDYIGDELWQGTPLSIEHNSFTTKVDGASFLETPTQGFKTNTLNVSNNTIDITTGGLRSSHTFNSYGDIAISNNSFTVQSFFDVYFDVKISNSGGGSHQISNNQFHCSSALNRQLGTVLSGSKYELNIRRANRATLANSWSTFRPDFSILLGGNTFCDGDIVVNIENLDSAGLPISATISNNQSNGNVSITTLNSENEISGNTFNNTTAMTSSSMAMRKYELQVRAASRAQYTSSRTSATDGALLNYHNNTLTGFTDVTISIDDTASVGSIMLDSNTVAQEASAATSLYVSKFELNIRRANRATLALSSAQTTGVFSYTHNTVSGFGEVLLFMDDSSGTLSTSITGNVFTGTGSVATASQSNMPAGNKYEVSVRKSKTYMLSSNNAGTFLAGGEVFEYLNNTVTGFGEVLVSVDDLSGTMSSSMTGNTFEGIGMVATTSQSNMPAGNKYEVAVRKSKTIQVSSTNAGTLSAVGEVFEYLNNTVTGFGEVLVFVDDSSGTLSTSITGNAFTGTGSVASTSQSNMPAGNKYEVAVRKSKTFMLSSNNAGTFLAGGEWFTYENNTVSDYAEGIFDLTNEGDAGNARLEGNTFGTLTVTSNHAKLQGALIAGNKYEVSVRKSKNYQFSSNNAGTLGKESLSFATGDSLIVRNNTFTDLDGGGFFLNTENNSIGDTLNVWLDGNTLSSSSAPFRFNLYESEFDSGYTKFLETANVINGGTQSSNVIDGRYNLLLGAMFASSSAKLQPYISTSPNIFSNGGGLQFTGSPIDTIQLNFQNIFGNTMNVINATNNVVDARYCWWGTTDSASIASKMQGNVLFMPFLAESLSSTVGSVVGRVYLDADASYSYNSGEMLLQGQVVTLWQNNSITSVDTTDLSGAYSFSNIPVGNYTVKLMPINGYVGTENADGATFAFIDGNVATEDFGIYQELQRYRTFKADTLLSKKPVKIAFKNGVLTSAYPNTVTALENVFARLGKSGATFLGVPQTNKNRAKLFAWIAYTKAADLGKLYLSAHTGTSYPIDSLRPAGKKVKFLKGALKADRKTYNNIAWEQGVAFNLNVIASALGVTPQGFGDLVVDSSIILGGRDIEGMTLTEVSAWMNSLMTYWDSLGVDNSTAYAELGSFASNFLKRINDGFAASVTAGNSAIDTAAVLVDDIYIPGTKKNPYAVTLNGVATASSVGLVKYVPGNTPAVVIQDAGYSEEAEVPTSFGLQQNYPNPFNPSTVISYSLPVDGMVTLKIYDILGREVATVLQNEAMETGNYQTTFNATSLTSGVYFYRIKVESTDEEEIQHTFTDVKRMVLIK